VALQLAAEGVGVRVPNGGPAHGGRKGRIVEDRSRRGVEGRHFRRLRGDGSDHVALDVLVVHPQGVGLAVALDALMGRTALDVVHAPEGVVGDDRRDDRLEGCDVRDRGRDLPHGGLGVAGLDKVCHFFFLLPACSRAHEQAQSLMTRGDIRLP